MDYLPILILFMLAVPVHANVLPFGNIRLNAPQDISASINRGAYTDTLVRDNVVYLRGKHTLTVQNHAIEVTSQRALQFNKIVKLTRKAARLLGPIGLAVVIADLIYDSDTKTWKVPKTHDQTGYTLGAYKDLHNQTHPLITDLYPYCIERGLQLGKPEWRLSMQVRSSTEVWCFDSVTGIYGNLQLQQSQPQLVIADDQTMEQKISESLDDDNKRIAQTQKLMEYTPADTLQDADPITHIEGPLQAPTITRTRRVIGPEGATETTTQDTPHIEYKPDSNEISIKNTRQETTTLPDGTTTQKTIEDESNQPQQEQKPDDCEANPDRLGCLTLGTPENIQLPVVQHEVTFTQERTATGTCPQPIAFNYFGHEYSMSWDYVCQYASAIRPLVITLATLTASIWLFAIFRK